ncbi:response regulator [Candidatus Saccharibacteria bacterium]|nr:MAG: response regulator [Candidatus Saccharibacteria bacterium]
MASVKIAVVEDEVAIRRLYETKFRLEGFTVLTAGDGAAGYRLLKNEQPDVVLLDLRMPGMQGEELLAKVRAQDWGASMRVIILTNLSRDEAPSSLRFLHVDRYIVKAHYTPSQVVDVVREVLRLPKHT